MSTAFFSYIESLALRTWPAETEEYHNGWFFRASGGITRRANSIWTSDGTGPWQLDDARPKMAEAFYRKHLLPLRYHISDASPAGLDAWLERQGYAKETPCSVMIADTDEVCERTEASRNTKIKTVVQHRHDPAWVEHFIHMEGFKSEAAGFYDGLFHRVKPDKGFVSLIDGERCVGAGMAVAEDGWAGFVNVVIHPQERGCGLGKLLLHELAQWSRDHGASRLYLQVMNDNAPAIRLYSSTGYKRLYGFHYRTQTSS
ncbi:GNAT family N-acetyltransferase [Paenibacillus naphthalenovorans]|uniref:GCN5-related N-acetyltransferase n=1 Tax=Paenibacillus naphthalenovorans TaxID=162209 RepID=A0A0U2U826_9BACL|nr:GNAT family N-acetyltransferase [Paenibacillus naphthalenovorans]ALS22505.1 GCN5-related N-acetyltransferase [Paenibacillus naphthalenovorans]